MASTSINDTVIRAIDLGNAIQQRCKNAGSDLKELGERIRDSLSILNVFWKVIERGFGKLLGRQHQDITLLIENLHEFFDRLYRQLYRFPSGSKSNIAENLHWTFKGKSGYKAILHEIAEWKKEVHRVVEAIKLLREVEKKGDRDLYKQLIKECGGVGIRRAAKMDDILHGPNDPFKTNNDNLKLLPYIGARDNLKDGSRLILHDCKTFVELRNFEARRPQEIEKSIEDVYKLASLLQQVDAPSMHILRCKGTTYDGNGSNPRALLFYEVPIEPKKEKWTLGQAIGEPSLMPPLNTRIRYAVEISTAVMFTHAAGLIHKSIRPENVLILRNSPADKAKHEFSAYVVGFDAARLRGSSYYELSREMESDTAKRLYQHPERQIPLPDGKAVRFGIRHDMYSLGVVLLELAMWTRIKNVDDSELQKLRKASEQDFNPSKLQQKLVKLADQTLSGSIGKKYAEAVRCCLKDTTTEKNLKNEQKMRGLFYERVLQPLKEIIL